jgi:hypothetical protein
VLHLHSVVIIINNGHILRGQSKIYQSRFSVNRKKHTATVEKGATGERPQNEWFKRGYLIK